MTEADLNTNTNDRRIRPEGRAQAVLARRGLIRAGAIAAADAITVGGTFTANNRTTALEVTNSTTLPALRLTNPTGPSLELNPISDGQDLMLPLGGLAGTKTRTSTDRLDRPPRRSITSRTSPSPTARSSLSA